MEVNTMAHFWVIPVFCMCILRHPFNMFSILILPFGIEENVQGYRVLWKFSQIMQEITYFGV